MQTNKLLGIMAEKGISQKKLAELMGISKNTISSKLKSEKGFTTSEVISICRILGIYSSDVKCEIFLT